MKRCTKSKTSHKPAALLANELTNRFILLAIFKVFSMAGLTSETPIPTEIKLHQQSRLLELSYEIDGKAENYHLSHEFLRVFSPSAEVRGHGKGQEILQVGKADVFITQIEATGNYAIHPSFSDGHDSGIYSWDILYFFCQKQNELWQAYLEQLITANESRDPTKYPAKAENPPQKCGFMPK